MNLTLIAHQEANSYSNRCGDRYSHDGSLNIHYSTSEDEIAGIWSEYLLKNQYLEEAELEYQFTLLQNGVDDGEWGTDEYYDLEETRDRIKALADSKIAERLDEKKRRDEAQKQARIAREQEQQRHYQLAREKEERAQYEKLRAKFDVK